MQKIIVQAIKVGISVAFFFTFWVGAIYIMNFLVKEKQSAQGIMLFALFMSIIFTYFTDCGSKFLKPQSK